MDKPSVVVVGSCNIDFTCYSARLPEPGETIYGSNFTVGFGGKGANQVVAAAKLGASVGMVAKLGHDRFGKEYIDLLDNLGINTKHVTLSPLHSTGIAQISVTAGGESYITIVPGANNEIYESDVYDARAMLENAEVGIFQFEISPQISKEAMKIMRDSGKGIVILNCAPALDVHESIYALANILILNESEVYGTVKVKVNSPSDAQPALDKLLKLGCDVVIITLGSQGAVFATKEKPEVTSLQVAAVQNPPDTTGAGDAFCGALAFAFIEYKNMSLEQKVRFACEIARESVMKLGAQDSFPDKHILQEIMERLKSQ